MLHLTVYRIKKDHILTPKAVDSINSRIVVELAKALYNVVLGLEFLPLIGEENIEEMTRDIAKNFTVRLAEKEPRCMRSVLGNSGYYDYQVFDNRQRERARSERHTFSTGVD